MIKIKFFLLILPIILIGCSTNNENSSIKTYPEKTGYKTEVAFSKYIKSISIFDGVHNKNTPQETNLDPITFTTTLYYLKNMSYQSGYTGNIKTEKLAFVSEDRKTVIIDYEGFNNILKIGDDSVINLSNSKLKEGESGYLIILFKDPDNKNIKSYIKVHIKKVAEK